MKQLIKYFLGVGLVTVLVAGCEKKEVLPFYAPGNAPVLTSSTNTVAATPADSSSQVITFNWTYPKYATDSLTVKYILEMDSAGRNFSKATRRVLTGVMSTSFLAKEMNEMMIGYGFKIGEPYSLEAHVISSYANNNEQYASNTVAFQGTPYKIPPKIPVPAELVIVGDASQGGWDNPPGGTATSAAAVAQKFAKIDETTYAGIFQLNGGNQYLMLPKSGDWTHKFGGTSKTGGDLLVDGDVPGSNTPAPDADGWYQIVVDFQLGKYTVTAVTNPVPDHMYGIGDATVAGWDNTAVGGQELARLNSIQYQVILPLSGGKSLKFISTIGQWQPQFGKGTNEGDLGANYGTGSDPNSITPASDGNYLIDIDFLNFKYKLTKQ